ncbi:hypothetical protein H4R20_000142 [Coemansia guatemalensis]|uniref:Acetyl-CoA synthetase-like protein n=1 Tax=Coemansia guatemalensis TaxID=2761395 RepID=A0A9W8HZU5_9FUNG|nr:hypothetical protein H4R20_000142 [Coemansia guatemalensis]
MVLLSIKSSLGDIQEPFVDVPTFFFNSLRRHNVFTRGCDPRPVFIDDARAQRPKGLTLDRLEIACTRLASGLYHNVGVRQGDVIAVVLPNSIYYPVVLMASLMVGASCTLANPAYTPRELHHQLKDTQARHIVTTAALCATVASAVELDAASIGKCQLLVVDRTRPKASTLPVHTIFEVSDRRRYPRFRLTSAKTVESKVAFIPYSSGTTGLPKGVLLSHRNIVANVLQAASANDTAAPVDASTCAGVLPMFHSFGLTFICLLMPYMGVSTVVMSRFEMGRFLEIIQDYRVSETMLPPPIVNAMAKMPDLLEKYDLSSLLSVTVGAAPLSSSTIAVIEKQLPNVCIQNGYGLSEASPAISLNSIATRNTQSIGHLLPSIEAKVLDADGRLLGYDESGELCFRGPNVMLGYLNNPAETSLAIDSDGFLHTGDIGHINQEQHLFITDRKKELIKFNGFQVAPAELECLLLQHPLVRDCAVAGVFDSERQTEVPKAYLVLAASDAEQNTHAGQEIVEWLNAQVAYFKQLRGGFKVIDAIPRNASGKILRRLLN